MFVSGGAPLLAVGERYHHRYRKYAKSCAQLHVDVCERFLAALV
jgi:hypothetical protein